MAAGRAAFKALALAVLVALAAPQPVATSISREAMAPLLDLVRLQLWMVQEAVGARPCGAAAVAVAVPELVLPAVIPALHMAAVVAGRAE